MTVSGLIDLVQQRSIIVCCGSGGVGKTTVSASFALEGARRGRRTCVVTIDPAKRLANALGVGVLTNVPSQIEGPWEGELWALMLDPKTTFDDLVRRYAPSPQQAEVILANGIYRNLTGALSGTQEYMAMEKLYELAEGGQFDLIVVDTPPTRNALDFLDAPRRLTRFLGHRLFQLLLLPTRAYLRAVSVATQALLRTISKVAGTEIVQDAVAFFQAFEGMEEGFRLRADHMRRLLAQPTTAFVLVTSPRPDTVEEAGWFADKLNESDLAVEGLVVNRVHPSFPTVDGLPVTTPGTDLDVVRGEPQDVPGHKRSGGSRLRGARHPGGPLAGVPGPPARRGRARLERPADRRRPHVRPAGRTLKHPSRGRVWSNPRSGC